MNFTLNRKGFLGPIGDDLPSLIPLIFALIIFFASFSSTFQLFDSQNREFADSIKILKMASALKGDSYFSSAQDFINSCKELKAKGVNFRAVLLEDLTAPQVTRFLSDPSSTGIDPEKIVSNPRYYIDNEIIITGESNTPLIYPFEEDTIPGTARLQVRLFPVAFEDHNPDNHSPHVSFVVRPATLMVIVWR